MTSDELSGALDLKPRIFRSVGEPRLDNSGTVIGYNGETFCTFKIIEAEQAPLHSVLCHAIDDLSGLADALAKIEMSGGALELYAGVFNEGIDTCGFTVSPQLVRKLAALNVSLTVEIYW